MSPDYRVQDLVSSLIRVEQALRSNADEVAQLLAEIREHGAEISEKNVDLTSRVSHTLFSVFNTSNLVSPAQSAIFNAAPRG